MPRFKLILAALLAFALSLAPLGLNQANAMTHNMSHAMPSAHCMNMNDAPLKSQQDTQKSPNCCVFSLLFVFEQRAEASLPTSVIYSPLLFASVTKLEGIGAALADMPPRDLL